MVFNASVYAVSPTKMWISQTHRPILCFFLLFSLHFLYLNTGLCKSSTEKEKTLAIIKPDGFLGNHREKIKSVILESGFAISKEITIQLDEDNVKSFYAEHSSKGFFHSLVKYMTSGPVVVMVLDKENAVSDWRSLIGPTDSKKAKITHPHSVRAMCGTDLEKNCVHGSDSPESAQREITFFFEGKSLGKMVATKHDEL